MRLVWASLAVALLAGCGQAAGSPIGMDQPLVAGGMEMLLVQATVKDDAFPFRQPPPGTHCIVYTVQVRAVDHARHDLRPDQFSADGGVPGDALGRCNAPELEPIWVTDQPRQVEITILERQAEPAPLVWSPPR
jgi:hypothetical protein